MELSRHVHTYFLGNNLCPQMKEGLRVRDPISVFKKREKVILKFVTFKVQNLSYADQELDLRQVTHRKKTNK